ncbi:sushi, von Willebrand factor type A, EGF and pentraxin domain-containing protein 1-like [Haliotis rubra]|uniref:sushi, von Willebrand factor type A, EGF and pentraxin domain-containing protein 1-like n=1 Tax=Haliotis rubra TaxID=36100 RepID=UPI001EE549B8|nr:sushi, von Willebrand factor type A, EGF and pentraxin domain-containing protein 1-like [Haliotis rubra]
MKLLGLSSVILAVSVHYASCCCRPSPPKRPPSPWCPSINPNQYADRGKATATVHWQLPVTGKCSRLTLVVGSPPGSPFSDGRHCIRYRTSNPCTGLWSDCARCFTVKVRRCSILPPPNNGKVNCLQGRKFGDTCRYSCDKGYNLVGSAQTTCEVNGWSTAAPTCKVNSCSTLVLPKNAVKFECDNNLLYGSVCQLTCDRDKGYASTKAKYAKCGEQGWSTTDFQCTDVEPPVFHNCPSQTIHQTLDPASNLTSVIWPKISVSDNSGQQPTMTPTSPYTVTSIGGSFPEGTHIVRFDAEDAAGNKATQCIFIVEVERVECDPPTINGEYIDTPSCLPPFDVGKQCRVECALALPLKGKRYITCSIDTGSNPASTFWDWGQNDSPPLKQPYCQVDMCTNLTAPKNGAISCGFWTGQRLCNVHCNEQYDIPDSTDYEFKCYGDSNNDPTWHPVVYRLPKECTQFVDLPWNKRRLPVYLIYNGPCNNAIDDIKKGFINQAKNVTSRICSETSTSHCNVNNVQVYCGGTRKRRSLPAGVRRSRRSTTNYIVFDIDVEETTGLSNDEQVINARSTLNNVFKELSEDSAFTANGIRISPSGLAKMPEKRLCQNGYVKSKTSGSKCVPCPKGMYYREEKCELCPLGLYQDITGSTECKKCPAGYTTLQKGSFIASQCKEMCKPGYLSPNGLSPCSPCRRGRFQPEQGQTLCIRCPIGFTTEKVGSSTQLQCVSYDISFEGPVSVNMSPGSKSELREFTFGIWVKIDSKGNHIVFEMFLEDTVSFSVSLSSDIAVAAGSNHIVKNSVLSNSWVHVAIVWTTENVTIFRSGDQIHHQRFFSSVSTIPPNTRMRITVQAVQLRSLVLVSSADAATVATVAGTCEAMLPNAIFSVENLNMTYLDRVLEVIPSSCQEIDPCEGFCGTFGRCSLNASMAPQCHCSGGYTDPRCMTPPDKCADNDCAEGSTCVAGLGEGAEYTCACPPGFTGTLCDDEQPDGEWGMWGDWGACSVTCGRGYKTRHRSCDSLQDGSKPCVGNYRNTEVCNAEPCRVCHKEYLLSSRDIADVTCTTDSDGVLQCDSKCRIGLVQFQSDMKYSCKEKEWTPGRVVRSCAEPASPVTVQLKYTVVHTQRVPDLKESLSGIAERFACVKSGVCGWHVTGIDCDNDTTVCTDNSGVQLGVLTLDIHIVPGVVDVSSMQTNPELARINKNLLSSNGGFMHESNERYSPSHRDIEITMHQGHMIVQPYGRNGSGIAATGGLGAITAAWNILDKANWEVRSVGYRNFTVGDNEPYLKVEQNVTCAAGRVPGGLFCSKCPLGTFYSDGMCEACPVGFYQNHYGQLSCTPCPGFATTPDIGIPYHTMCLAPESPDQYLLVASGQNTLTKTPLTFQNQSIIILSNINGSVTHHVYSATDNYIYYSTQSPASIGRIRWDGNRQLTIINLKGEEVTGLAVDERSGLVFYTLRTGSLKAVTSDRYTKDDIVILNGLDSPSDLVLHQEKFMMYWAEGQTIQQYRYGNDTTTLLKNTTQDVLGLRLNSEVDRLMWYSNGQLISCDTDGEDVTPLVDNASPLFGLVNDYYFYANETRLYRVNADGVTRAQVMSLASPPTSVSVISTSQQDWGTLKCSGSIPDGQACWQIDRFETKRLETNPTCCDGT